MPSSRYGVHTRFTVLEFSTLLDSSSISSDGWTAIALTIQQNYHLFDGFVILHGTDSLAYTSSALSFMFRDLGKPVILTGSQTPMSQLLNDANDNLISSLIIASHFLIPEVCLFFNDKLFRGNRVTKVSADDFDAFESPDCPLLATIRATGTRVNWDVVRRPTAIREMNVQTNLSTASVACLRIFPGITPELVDSVLSSSELKGLVLETFGAGNAPAGKDNALVRVLQKWAAGTTGETEESKRRVVIVNITQCLRGTVSPVYEAGNALAAAGVVPGGDMTSEAALTKLAYLLSLPNLSLDGVAMRMKVSERGELTDDGSPAPQFTHPEVEAWRHAGMVASPRRDVVRFAELARLTGEGDLASVIERFDKNDDGRWKSVVLNARDNSGNSLLHIAASSLSSGILRLFLQVGASVHVRNDAGHTPLYYALQDDHLGNVQLLREAGAHLHIGEPA
ncbi:MAG: hypothetical protein M1831_002439 [Alyxoria varia]|nr:MAG: hypothetical protein M1831_002439 [Alyxoria varia]